MAVNLRRQVLAIFALFLVGNGCAQQNWRSRQKSHVETTKALDIQDVDYFGNQLANEGNFMEHLKTILIPRVPDSEGSRIVREHIKDSMTRLGWDVEVSEHTQKTPVGEVTFRNVIATLDPDAPRRLVLACHYDTLVKPKGFVGLTDSAVPCSQMLNLAHTMNLDLNDDKNAKHEVTLQFLFFDGEEAYNKWSETDSTYGSRNLAEKWEAKPFSQAGVNVKELHRIDLFVLLDLIGAKNPSFVSLKSATQQWYNRLVRIERELSPTLKDYNPRRPIFQNRQNFFARVEDDHLAFEQRGVPILHLISVPFPDVWHKIGDDMSALDKPSVENINKILRVFVAEYLKLGR